MDTASCGERVIIETRYGGTYEGGLWAAFASPQIPEEARGDDVECQLWWASPTVAVGIGSTPDEALEGLDRITQACPHPDQYRMPVPAGFTCRYCNLLARPAEGSVEDLLAVVDGWPQRIPLNLFVPDALTRSGASIDHNVAMALSLTLSSLRDWNRKDLPPRRVDASITTGSSDLRAGGRG